jgi:transcriptional regulator with GAF, ATPase, and Fis domain
MDKTAGPDRAAVRTSLWNDAERDALRELVGDPGGGTPSPRPVAAAAPAAPTWTEQLLRLHRRLAREDRLEPLLEQVIDAVMELTSAERGALVVLGPDGRREVTRELGGPGQGVQFSQSVIERVLASAEPVLSVDAAADDRFDGSRSISHLNLRSVLAVPLLFRGEVLGAVYVDHRLRRGNFDDRDLAHVEEFAELAALAVAHARALDEVRRQADHLATSHAQLAELVAEREAEVVGLRARVDASDQDGRRHGIVGTAPAMQRVYRLVDRLADNDVPVVIYGESGTGKELVARAIHNGGARKSGPFIAENCGAIPETLLESVLFGHAKGSFTGADRNKIGLFEAACGGTIFLDEVGEMSPSMQTKLLRVLQEGEVRRVGENVSRRIDVRVIAASNRDLDAMVEQGKFRRDLYYRIHVVRVELPPLRERPADIVLLLQHFLARRGTPLEVPAATVRALQGYAWPGNVRELENEVQRWVALCDGRVTPEDLSPAIRGADPAVDPDDLRIRPRVERLERDLIARALDRARGNQTRAAELLGLSRFGLQKKLRKLDEGAAADAGPEDE